MYVIEHFIPNEFKCKCGQCEGGCSVELVMLLDLVRCCWGGPIRITSGYRCAAHNTTVGGVSTSRHLIGIAADVTIPMATGKWSDFCAVVGRVFDRPGYEYLPNHSKRYIHVALPRRNDVQVDIWKGGKVKCQNAE